MKKEIYLDHAATTRMWPQVQAVMEPYLTEHYGNASTAYDLGKDAKKAMENARGTIAQCLEADPEEIFFTSGGSESDNWAIKSIAGEKKFMGNHIITSAIEHHAVLHSCRYLESLGYDVTYLGVDGDGLVSLSELKDAITQKTTLITIMYGNNEIGTIEPVMDIGLLARKNGVIFHTDAVQAVGQVPLALHRLPVDALSASAHKFHGPKGIGFLYVKKDLDIPSFIHGGAQERGKRAGTENVASIVGMAKALELSTRSMAFTMRRVTALRDYFVKRVMGECERVTYNGHPSKRLPGNASFSFAGVDATALLVLLEEDGVCAAAGSACNTGESRLSHVIRAIHVPKDRAAGTIRFTFGEENTKEEADRAVEVLKEDLKLLRGIE
jgi:cysteine desulfurase